MHFLCSTLEGGQVFPLTNMSSYETKITSNGIGKPVQRKIKTKTAMKTLQKTSVALLLVCGGAVQVQAAPLVYAIYDASQANWNAEADWQAVGPQYSNLGTGFSMSLPSGLSFDVSTDDGRLERRDQGSGWLGNFNDQEPLLRKARGEAPIVITFDAPVRAFGTQVQNDIWA